MAEKEDNGKNLMLDFYKFRNISYKRFSTLIDRLNFFYILMIWIITVIIFGVAYYSLSGDVANLFFTYKGETVNDLVNSIYFSFVTASTSGFSGIIPFGFFRIMAIIEVMFGLLLLALVTSKLVSIKQDIILNEIYEMSLNEKINRLRSSFLLFRQNIGKIMSRIEEGFTRKREVSDLYNYLSSLEDDIDEAIKLIKRQGKNHFTKDIDSVSLELILNSILSSFEKLNELFDIMNKNNMEWKKIFIIESIDRCIILNDRLFEEINIKKILKEKTVQDLIDSKNKINQSIKELLKHN
ncbi:two pore domain potassium channel family protein [Candidatus Woesearchaeota archaeon]|nr:two pore domain potassium channel family protein [Candidatus Woesearchaeota archaeon]